MVTQRKILINSPIINELVFDFLFELTPEQRKKLSPKEIRAIRTAKRARHYVSKATLDEKLLTLAKLGVQFSFILHQNNPLDPKAIKARYEKYKEMSKEKILDDMTLERFVVLTDRVLVNFMNMMGQNSHSEAYLLNMDYHRVGEFMNKWKEHDRPDVDSIQQSLEFARVINRYTLNVSTKLKTIKGDTQVADIDLNLLMYLYDKQKSYVPRDMMENHFLGLYKKTIMTAAIKRLFEKVYIERNPEKNKPEYQITALGNMFVMDFHRRNLAETV